MTRLMLTKSAVDSLASDTKAYIAYDAEIAGFGCRVMPSGTKTFILEYRPHGGGRGVAKRRFTIGRLGKVTPDEARKAARRLLASVTLGGDPAAALQEQRAALTVAELIEAFEAEHVAGKLKGSSGEGYRLHLSTLRTAIGSQKAEGVTRGQIATLHSKRRSTPYAANRALAVWSKLFSWAGKRGLLPDGMNPAKGIERYREQGRERFLTSGELARLGEALRLGETEGLPWRVKAAGESAKHVAKPENRKTVLDPFAAAAIRLLLFTGARLREILHLKWSEVDFERGIAFLSDSKTGKKPVYLSAPALEILGRLPRIAGNPHVIPGEGEGAPKADLKKPWQAVTEAAGLEGVRLHDLRHSFASFGAGASLGLPVIGRLLGHSQAATTHRYAHLDVDPVRRAADTIGGAIAAAMESDGALSSVAVLRPRRAK